MKIDSAHNVNNGLMQFERGNAFLRLALAAMKEILWGRRGAEVHAVRGILGPRLFSRIFEKNCRATVELMPEDGRVRFHCAAGTLPIVVYRYTYLLYQLGPV